MTEHECQEDKECHCKDIERPLKTLKDFNDDDVANIVLEPVRKEAIKWVKHNCHNFKCPIEHWDPDWKDAFKDFFNITEEDLK